MKLQLKILVIIGAIALIAPNAMAEYNMTSWGTDLWNEGPNTQTNFHVCVRGDVRGYFQLSSGGVDAPDFVDHADVTYDAGTNVTKIVWVGQWGARTTGSKPSFGFRISSSRAWVYLESGWGAGNCVYISIDPRWANCLLVGTNLSFDNAHIRKMEYVTGPSPFDPQDLNSTGLPANSMTPIAFNTFLPAGGTVQIPVTPVSYWRTTTDSALVLSGNGSLWCGEYYSGSAGYGNSWNQTATYTHVVTNPAASSTVDWSFLLRQDTEPAYDNVYVEYNMGGTWQVLQSHSGAGTETVNEVFSMQPADYAGPGNDEIQLRVRFKSDGAWSPADGSQVTTAGACQIDDVSVSVNGLVVEAEGFELGTEGNWAPGFAVPPPPLDCGASYAAFSIATDWFDPGGGFVRSSHNWFGMTNQSLLSPVLNTPSALQMLGAHPNPFNPSTTISYTIPITGQVDLSVFDISGRHIASLVSEMQIAGPHEVTWTGQDDAGRAVSSGTYFVRLRTGDTTENVNVVLIK